MVAGVPLPDRDPVGACISRQPLVDALALRPARWSKRAASARQFAGTAHEGQERRDKQAGSSSASSDARTRESCSKLCVITTAASLASKHQMRRRRIGQIDDGQHAHLIGRRKAFARGQVRTAVGDGDKPAQFACQLNKRLGIVSGAEDPESPGARRDSPPRHAPSKPSNGNFASIEVRRSSANAAKSCQPKSSDGFGTSADGERSAESLRQARKGSSARSAVLQEIVAMANGVRALKAVSNATINGPAVSSPLQQKRNHAPATRAIGPIAVIVGGGVALDHRPFGGKPPSAPRYFGFKTSAAYRTCAAAVLSQQHARARLAVARALHSHHRRQHVVCPRVFQLAPKAKMGSRSVIDSYSRSRLRFERQETLTATKSSRSVCALYFESFNHQTARPGPNYVAAYSASVTGSSQTTSTPCASVS